MAEYRHIKRSFGPVWNENSKILILGSFPSVKSREVSFYYGHPQNRFWRVIAAVLSCPAPETIDEKRAMLLSHSVALWDTIEECDIIASDDNSIKNAVGVDIMSVLNHADIRAVYCNGAMSHKLFMRLLHPVCSREAVKLPSTSPANAAWSLDRLIDAWSVIRSDLDA